jgi:hypothetical protein
MARRRFDAKRRSTNLIYAQLPDRPSQLRRNGCIVVVARGKPFLLSPSSSGYETSRPIACDDDAQPREGLIGETRSIRNR